MVDDQKLLLVSAAYGDGKIWDSLLDLYLFAPAEEPALRSYIQRTYDSNGNRLSEDGTRRDGWDAVWPAARDVGQTDAHN